MQQKTIERIVRVLNSDAELVKRWSEFYNLLDLSPAEKVILEQQYKSASISPYDLFHIIIGKWISRNGNDGTLDKLAALLEESNFKLVADILRSIEPASQDQPSIACKVENSDQKTESKGATAAEVLNLIAYFEADNIPVYFITGFFLSDTTELGHIPVNICGCAISELKKNFLITVADNYISVPKQVQADTRVKLNSSRREGAVLTRWSYKLRHILQQAQMESMTHILSLWAWCYKNDDLVKEFADLPYAIGTRLLALTRYQEMLFFSVENYKLLNQILGSDHVETLKVGCLNAEAMQLMGKFKDAEKRYEDVYAEQRLILGEEHETTLHTRLSMSWNLYSLGKKSEALKLSKCLLELKMITNGQGGQHYFVARTKILMACVLMDQRQCSEGMRILQEVLVFQKEKLGDGHPDTLKTKYVIGRCLHRKGNFKEAKEFVTELLELTEKVFGKENVQTLDVKALLGYILFDLGERAASLRIFEEILPLFEHIFGEGHYKPAGIRRWIHLVPVNTVVRLPSINYITLITSIMRKKLTGWTST